MRTGSAATSIVFILALLLTACGGSGGSDSSSGGSSSSSSGGSSSGGSSGGSVVGVAPATAAIPALTFPGVKTFGFTWSDVSDATHYKLLENPDGVSGFAQVGNDIAQGVQRVDHVVPLYSRVNAQYMLQSCNAAGCTDSANVAVSGTLVTSIGYVKASTTGAGDEFSISLGLSADGNTLAVGARYEDSSAAGINGDQADNLALSSGAVYVFTRTGSGWSQQAYIKASNTEADDQFGHALSLSGDGNTLAVGAYGEDSSAAGINGDQLDNATVDSGAVYVFTRVGATWSQQAYIKASNPGTSGPVVGIFSGDRFGQAVSLSADGNTLA
ncbi:MAG: FG-GAP repeat protein, partial [Gammaproteobacteria bacterium]